jgi:chromosome segregation ATPase
MADLYKYQKYKTKFNTVKNAINTTNKINIDGGNFDSAAKAKQKLSIAKIEHEKAKQLFDTAIEQLKQAKTDVETAKIKLETANAQLIVMNAHVETAKINLDQLQIKLTQATHDVGEAIHGNDYKPPPL